MHIKMVKLGMVLLSYLVALVLGCGESPESARIKLGQMGVEYSEASFVQRAVKGDVVAVQLFLKGGMNPNVTNQKGVSPLLAATMAGREEVMKVLEAKGAEKTFLGRYTMSKEGIVTDTKTGLEWYAGPDRDTNWDQAKAWVQSLKVAAGGWRMPTRQELAGLYQSGLGERNMFPGFKTTGSWVWSGEAKDSSSAWFFPFSLSVGDYRTRDFSYNLRAFAVRSRR